MSRDQLLKAAADSENRSARIRERFGLAHHENQDRVTDWLQTAGAVPTALAAICLVVYLAVSLIAGLAP